MLVAMAKTIMCHSTEMETLFHQSLLTILVSYLCAGMTVPAGVYFEMRMERGSCM
jgi:hypothetical protein